MVACLHSTPSLLLHAYLFLSIIPSHPNIPCLYTVLHHVDIFCLGHTFPQLVILTGFQFPALVSTSRGICNPRAYLSSRIFLFSRLCSRDAFLAPVWHFVLNQKSGIKFDGYKSYSDDNYQMASNSPDVKILLQPNYKSKIIEQAANLKYFKVLSIAFTLGI